MNPMHFPSETFISLNCLVNVFPFNRLGVLAPDGYCRPFDIDATGYTRSEAICVIFLQKAKNSKRIYSTVLYSKTNCDGELQDLE